MLRGGKLSSFSFEEEEVDPMAGVANLADVMLVFACGLMVAIILNWNIDLTKTKIEMLQKEQLQEIENPEEMVEDMENDANAYEEKGVVYQDPETGKMYVIMPREGGN